MVFIQKSTQLLVLFHTGTRVLFVPHLIQNVLGFVSHWDTCFAHPASGTNAIGKIRVATTAKLKTNSVV